MRDRGFGGQRVAVGTALAIVAIGVVAIFPALAGANDSPDVVESEGAGFDPAVLEAPVRLEADGKPIDVGEFSKIAHAGPAVADVDGDGDRDLVVGDFPGYFWLFENRRDDRTPKYVAKGKLQAGGEAAKTPVY